MPENQKAATRNILSAIVMLAGIITISVGYYQLNKITINTGLFITLVGVVTAIIFMLHSISVRQKSETSQLTAPRIVRCWKHKL